MRGTALLASASASILAITLILLAPLANLSQAQNVQGSPIADASPDAALATAQSLDVPTECVVDAMTREDISPAGSPSIASPAVIVSIRVALVDLRYQPCALQIPANTPVTIALSNEGTAVGNFIVDELGVRSDEIEAGETTEVIITASAGTYPFYSDVPGQREAGRAGVLIVGNGTGPDSGTPPPGTPAS